MYFLPDWGSIESTSRWSDILFWAGIVCLVLLAATEVASHVYGSRASFLSKEAARHTEQQRQRDTDAVEAKRKAEVDRLQEKLTEADKKVASLEEKAAPRHLSESETDVLRAALTGQEVGQLVIKAMVTASDAASYAREIASVIQSVPGWQVRIDSALIAGVTPTGIWLTIKSQDSIPTGTAPLQHAFERAGLPIHNAVSVDPAFLRRPKFGFR